MTGPETYKEFDTASIVTRDTVSVGKLTLRKRDLLLGGIAVIALIIVIILAIVLAVEVGSKSSSYNDNPLNTDDPQKGAQNGSKADTGGKTDTDYCITPQCLKTAQYEKSIMNEKANPCENFYMYACGGYADVYTQSPLLPDHTPLKMIQVENVQKLLYLLQYEPERNEERSYERKLRHFMQSCTDHFDRMALRGTPLIDKVIKPFGGWYVLGPWSPSSFDLHAQLKKAHIDFWTPAFFTLSIATDTTDWNKKVIQLDYGGMGLPFLIYQPELRDHQIFALYKEYMMRIATLISEDAMVTPDVNKIDQFADDALEVEWALATAALQSPDQDNPHAPANRMTLGSLNQLTNNTLDLVDYFSSAFPWVTGMFTTNTAVAVLRSGFFHNLGSVLKNYTTSDDGKRKLHNYLVWQLIMRYVEDLSWDYVHAKRQLNYQLYGTKDDTSGFAYCFRIAERTMKDAMGALFVKNFFSQNDRQEANDILTVIKDEMVKELANLNWMTSDNRNSAIVKIKESLTKIGYPDYMVDDNLMDSMYTMVTISDIDYFGNILSLNSATRKRFSDVLASPDSKTTWAYHVFTPNIEYYNPWHELIVTAAMLQNPLFAHNGPAYYNHAGIGTAMAYNLIHAFDEYGSLYKMDKSNYGNWWTNTTRQRYLLIKECAINAQKDEKLGPFTFSDTQELTPNKTHVSFYYAPELLAEASGLRLSWKAYKAKMALNGTEKIPAGFPNYTLEKLFFLAFAQSHCANTPESIKAMQAYLYYEPPDDYKVNLAVSQVQEFREAFGCATGEPMAPAKTCTLF